MRDLTPLRLYWPAILICLALIAFILVFTQCTHPQQPYQQQITAEIEAIASEPTYDGELNPNEFMAWEISTTFPGPYPGIHWVVIAACQECHKSIILEVY